MSDTQPKDPRYWFSIWQFVLTLLAILGLVSGAGIAIIFGLVTSLANNTAITGAQQSPLLTMSLFAGGLVASALLLVPSAYYALRRINGHPVSHSPRLPWLLRPSLLIFLLPVVLLFGYWVSKIPAISWLLLPILNVLAIGLPVLWLLYLASRNLPLGSPQRMWGVFGSGLVLGPTIILILEILALVGFIFIGILTIVNQPQLMDQINKLMPSLQQGQFSQEQFIQVFLPWLTKPGLILAIIAFVGLVVPLIEEAVKPIGVWLLPGFHLTPAAGFAAGALSGAGYAFFESLALAGSGGDWTLSASARIATGVIHIFNTAMMGWAITRAWQDRRYINLGLTYLAVVLVHGTWNSLAVISAINDLLSQQSLKPSLPLVSWIGPVAPYILGGITLVMFILMLWMNRRLRPVSEIATGATTTDLLPDDQNNEPPQAVL